MKKVLIFLFTGLLFPVYSQPDIQIKDPWIRAVPPTMNMTAGYMVILNRGNEDDYLIAVKSNISKMADLHATVEENNVVKMKHIKKLKIPAGSKVELKPGGYHIMFMKLKEKLLPGKKFKITVIFEKSGKKVVEAEVKMSD